MEARSSSRGCFCISWEHWFFPFFVALKVWFRAGLQIDWHTMRRFNSAIQGSAEPSFDYPTTTWRPLASNVKDSKGLGSSRLHDHGPRCLKVLLALVMGALVVIILRTKHGSQMKLKKQSFIFPVYANSFNISWRDGTPGNNLPSVSGSSQRRSLLEKSEHPNYISEVRPALKHMYMIWTSF